MGGGSGVSFWREIIFLVQVYLNLAEKQANGPKGVQITLNFSIKDINKHFYFPSLWSLGLLGRRPSSGVYFPVTPLPLGYMDGPKMILYANYLRPCGPWDSWDGSLLG